jgi:hypothetical protein
LPNFINVESPCPDDLKHGENCLLVDSEVNAWNAAMDLISHNYDGLQKVASRARHASYFNFSIQKRLVELTHLLARVQRRTTATFFDKFLPL